ncbi:MAG: hypothetical protein A2139_10145 [Desulfobacca sp. RBG_16_60_12]|nr:MAG: hypothetical protein A2139_10145 [Desulfobacca sp. RBG_16_60_12]
MILIFSKDNKFIPFSRIFKVYKIIAINILVIKAFYLVPWFQSIWRSKANFVFHFRFAEIELISVAIYIYQRNRI